MKLRWLYLLIILALLIPGTRPRLATAMFAGSTPLQGASQGGPAETEEEEAHQRAASSRESHRIARGSSTLFRQSFARQYRRFHSARSEFPAIILSSHNGFGGNITC